MRSPKVKRKKPAPKSDSESDYDIFADEPLTVPVAKKPSSKLVNTNLATKSASKSAAKPVESSTRVTRASKKSKIDKCFCSFFYLTLVRP